MHGGSITIGAESEPACADWIDTCAGSSWGYWMMNPETIPHVYVVDPQNRYVLGAVMAGQPTLSAGPPQTVTYHINPNAVWSDGKPITSADIRYTWDQIVHGEDIFSTIGYSDIADIRTPSPNVAVAVFAKPYAAWKDLFGADDYGILPSHILQGQDRDALMRNGYSWSGGPWLIQSWEKGQSITLVPNTNYWGPKPNLDRVTFEIVTDTASEVERYKAGRFDLIYPQPDAGLAGSVARLSGSTLQVYPGLAYEGVWFNVTHFPLDDLAVRQALAYATDRTRIVTDALAHLQPRIAALQGSIAPSDAPFASVPFSRYVANPTMVTNLMTGAGWAKDPAGIWSKGGQEAAVQLKSTAGNARRDLIESALSEQWRAAGFAVSIQNESFSTLFGTDLPAGNFQAAVYANFPASPDPGQCVVWCSANIPAPANQNSGQNWTRINDPALDLVWAAADGELNPVKRTQDVRAGEAELANQVPFIPLDVLPDLLVRRDRLAGPVGDDASSGPFWNMERWYLEGPPSTG